MAARAGERVCAGAPQFFAEALSELLHFAALQFELQQRQGDRRTLRAHLETAARFLGRPDAKLIAADNIQPPVCLEHVWQWFVELCHSRSSNGFGMNPLSYSEIEAWSRLTRRWPTAFETEALLALDSHYLAAKQQEQAETGAAGKKQ